MMMTVTIASPADAAAALTRLADELGVVDDVWDWVCDHEDELGGRGIEVLMLSLEAAPFAEQLVKARDELLNPADCRRGRSK